MLKPTIEQLTQGKFNRYQLAIATAKCARIITDDYVHQRREAEKRLTNNSTKEERQFAESLVNADYRDKKAVKLAIDKIYNGEFVIVESNEDGYSTEPSQYSPQ